MMLPKNPPQNQSMKIRTSVETPTVTVSDKVKSFVRNIFHRAMGVASIRPQPKKAYGSGHY